MEIRISKMTVLFSISPYAHCNYFAAKQNWADGFYFTFVSPHSHLPRLCILFWSDFFIQISALRILKSVSGQLRHWMHYTIYQEKQIERNYQHGKRLHPYNSSAVLKFRYRKWMAQLWKLLFPRGQRVQNSTIWLQISWVSYEKSFSRFTKSQRNRNASLKQKRGSLIWCRCGIEFCVKKLTRNRDRATIKSHFCTKHIFSWLSTMTPMKRSICITHKPFTTYWHRRMCVHWRTV